MLRARTCCDPFISIIIPALDEAAEIAATIESAQCPFVEHEIIVVDGGSVDGTAQVAEKMGCRVVGTQQRQRAAQMNLGASLARGEVLLFLHADTHLQAGALMAIREALRDPRVVGGAFARRYDSRSMMLALTCRLAALRNRAIGWHLGDQAMFVRAEIFRNSGGFAEVAQFEDLDFSRRLARLGRVVTLRPAVLSSARRFTRRGALLTTVRDVLLTCRYLLRGLPQPSPSAAKPVPVSLAEPSRTGKLEGESKGAS